MVIEKKIRKRNLNRLEVLINDTGNEFIQVFDVPDSLPQGRSSFIINGSEYLKKDTEVLVEILDSFENPIFVNPVHDPDFITSEGTARSIALEIYPSTPPGRAVLTIVAELDEEKFIGGQPLTPEAFQQLQLQKDPTFQNDLGLLRTLTEGFSIPAEFRGVYNVKFQKVVNINPTALNLQPIKFYKSPQVTVRELIRAETVASQSTYTTKTVVTGSIKGRRIPFGETQLLDPGSILPVRATIGVDNDVTGINKVRGRIYNRSYPLTFTSADSFGTVIRRDWDFGDSETTSSVRFDGDEEETHTYTRSGSYVASLIVQSPTGEYSEDTIDLVIAAPPAPTASFQATQTDTLTAASVKQTGSMEDPKSRKFKFVDLSTNVEDIIDATVPERKFSNVLDTEYSWSFGDGNVMTGLASQADSFNAPGSVRYPEHTYEQSGSYTVALTVKNNYGLQSNTSTQTNYILIQPSKPVIGITANDTSVTEGEISSGVSVTFNANDIYYGSSITYAWDFGDGNTSTSQNPSNTYQGSHLAGTTFDVSLTVTDEHGRTTSQTVENMISVEPSIPVPDFTATPREFDLPLTEAGQTVQFTDKSTTDGASLTYLYTFVGGTTGSLLNSGAESSTFESGTFANGIFGSGALQSGATVEASSDYGWNGNFSMKIENDASVTADAIPSVITKGYSYDTSGESNLTNWKNQFRLDDITINHSYTMEFMARTEKASTRIQAGLFGVNAAGNVFGSDTIDGSYQIKEFTAQPNWNKYSFTFKFTNVSSKHLSAALGAKNLNPENPVYFDDVKIFRASSTQASPKAVYFTQTDGDRGKVDLSVTTTSGTERNISRADFINSKFGTPSASFTADNTTVSTSQDITFNASGSKSWSGYSSFANPMFFWTWGDGESTQASTEIVTHKYTTAGSYTPTLQLFSNNGSSIIASGSSITVNNPPAPTISLVNDDALSNLTGLAPQEIVVKTETTGQVTSVSLDFGDGTVKNSIRGGHVFTTPGQKTVTATATGPGGSATDTLTYTILAPPPEELDPPQDLPDSNLISENAVQALTLEPGTADPPAAAAADGKGTGGAGGGGDGIGCVVAGTLIRTSRGSIPVEEVTTKDLIYTYDFSNGEYGWYNIESAWNKIQHKRYFIETEHGKSLECSDSHLLYHPDYKKNEIPVNKLNVGDIVYSVDDDDNVIEDPIRNIVIYDEDVRVYNFTIPEIHSYISNGIISHNASKADHEGGNPFSQPFLMKTDSPEQEFFELITDDKIFTENMIGADINISVRTGSSAVDDLNKAQGSAVSRFVLSNPLLKGKIKKIKRGNIVVPDFKGPIMQNRQFINKNFAFKEFQDLGPSPFTMSFQTPATASFKITNKISYAKINLTQLRTYSGDVARVRLLYKEAGDTGGYKVLAEQGLEAREQLIDTSVSYGKLRLGFYSNQVHINKYWLGREGVNAGYYEGEDNFEKGVTLSYTPDVLPKSMRISGSNYEHNKVVTAFHRYPINLVAGTEYQVSFEAVGYKKPKKLNPDLAAKEGRTFKQDAKVRLYLSGSGVYNETGWGYDLGYLELENNAPSESFDKVEHNFIADKNGRGRLQLVAHSGEWYFRNVSIKPLRETGFSPDFSSMVVKTPQLTARGVPINLYAEFLDSNNNRSQIFGIGKSLKPFVGSSVNIERTDNNVSGSIFLGGNTEGSGIEIHGGSSYIRNVGYAGYVSASMPKTPDDPSRGKAGFMMFSGSVLTDRTDEYSIGDVGFEVHGGPGVNDGSAGAMRFRTSTGKLEVTGSVVATSGHFQNTFSVGTGSSQIQISASNSIIKTKNWTDENSTTGWAISGSGEAYFQEGYIGGWQIKTIDKGTATERAIISGSNITLDAGGAALYMSNRGPGSDDSTEATNFPVRANEYYIDFTPTSSQAVTSMDYFVKFGPNFSVDKDGVLFASGAVFEGKITSSAGQIGGWAIEDDVLRAASNAMILSGSGVISSSKFFVDEQGNLTASSGHFTGTVTASRVESDSGRVSGWVLNTGYLADSNNKIKLQPEGLYVISSSNFQVNSDGDVTGSSALFKGKINVTGTGTIAGFGLTAAAISSSNDNLILKSSGQITGSTALFTGGKIGGFTISSTQLSGGSGGTTVALTPGTGIHMGNASFASAPFSVTNAGVLKAESGTIGGWTLSSSTISSNNLTISSAGLIETNDFASGVKGFRLTAADGGSAEFEQVTIRGTLKTTVFEKESVNAVGGQLYVANSTTITGSSEVGASDTTIQVANASGFAAGEVLSVKKVTATGFSTEYMKVHSVAREDSSSDSNFSGSLVVTRSLSSGASGPSGSLGEAPGSGQSYGPGQVLVSTGKLGTGYIRINANPNDSATPYIDIVERTGSGTFDVDLKARLGDLSGLSTERLQGTAPTSAGFGLYSQNVFLEGGIIANTGSIAGVKMQNKQLFIGAGTHGNSNTAFYVSGKDDATAGDFSLGDKLVWDNSTSTLTISGQITLEAGGDTVPDTDGLISGSAQIAGDISGSQTATSSSLASRQSSYETQVVLDSNGMDLRDQSSVSLANYGTSARIGRSGESRVEISDTAISMYDGQSTPRKRVAIDNTGKAAFGGAAGADVSVSSTDDVIRIEPGSGVSIFEDSNNFAKISSVGMEVTQSGAGVAKFAAETVIGSSTDKVTISDSGITIRENDSDLITMSGGTLTAVDAFLSGDIKGDGFCFRSIKITSSNSSTFITGNILRAGGPDTGDSESFNFTRCEVTADIRYVDLISAGDPGGDALRPLQANFLTIESTGNVRLNQGSSGTVGSDGSKKINADSDDWFFPALNVLQHSGTRVQVFRSMNDSKIQTTSSYRNYKPLFYSGLQSTNGQILADGVDIPISFVDDPNTGIDGNGDVFWIYTNGTKRVSVDSSGNLIATGNITAFGSVASDKRLKTNIKTLGISENKILNLNPVEYEYKYGEKKGERRFGFIAQELEEHYPEAVTWVDDQFDDLVGAPTPEKGESAYKTIEMDQLVPHLVQLAQTQNERINKLEKELKELKNGFKK